MNFDEWREIYFAGPLMNEAMARAAWDAAIAAEREACARVCEELEAGFRHRLYREDFAAAIRARGNL